MSVTTDARRVSEYTVKPERLTTRDSRGTEQTHNIIMEIIVCIVCCGAKKTRMDASCDVCSEKSKRSCLLE